MFKYYYLFASRGEQVVLPCRNPLKDWSTNRLGSCHGAEICETLSGEQLQEFNIVYFTELFNADYCT